MIRHKYIKFRKRFSSTNYKIRANRCIKAANVVTGRILNTKMRPANDEGEPSYIKQRTNMTKL